MPIAWKRDAIRDREAIFDHIAQDNPMAALALDELFEQKARTLEGIATFRRGVVTGTFEYPVNPQYKLVYTRVGANIEIVNVVHTSRQWPPT